LLLALLASIVMQLLLCFQRCSFQLFNAHA
jgi:hypothetical protein